MANPTRVITVRLEEFQGGFVNKTVIFEMAKAKRQAFLQACGEVIRDLTSRVIRKAKSTRASAKVAQDLGVPRGTRIYAPNPPPRFPAVRGGKDGKEFTKGGRDLRNIARPLFRIDNPSNPRFVEVGPVKVRANPVPRVLERGGSIQTRSRRRVRKIGHGGEIRIDGGRLTKSGARRFGKRSATTKRVATDIGTVAVTYIKLRTAAQVDRANRLNQQLYLPGKRVTVPGRRYMKQISRMATTLPANVARIEEKAERLYRANQGKIRRISRQSSFRRRGA